MAFGFFAKKKRNGLNHSFHSEGVLKGGETENVASKEENQNVFFDRFIKWFIFGCLGALFFGITLFFSGLTMQGVIFDRYMFFLVFSLITFVVWAMGGVHSGKLKIRRTPLDIPLLFFWGVYGLSMFFSKDIWHSFSGSFSDPSRGFIVVTASILLYYVVVSTQNTRSLVRLAGCFVAGVSAFVVWSALAISGIFQGKSGILGFFSAIPMDNLLSLNILLTVAFPAVLSFLLFKVSSEKKKLFVPIALLIILGLCLYVLASLYLSMMLIALFVGMGILISYISGDIVHVSKRWMWLPTGIFLLALPVIYFLGQNILAKNGLELNQDTVQGVKIGWETVKNTLSEKFLLGVGPSMYEYAFSHYFPESLNATNIFTVRLSNSPNYFFEMLVTTGILGGLAFLGLLIFTLSIAVYFLTRKRGISSILSLGLWVSVLILVIAGFFYGISGSVVFPGIILAILATAILLTDQGQVMEARSVTLSLRAAPQYALASTLLLLIACIGGLALFATLGKVYVGDVYAGKAFMEQSKDKVKAIEYIEKALLLNAREGKYFVLRGKLYMDVANERLSKVKDKEDKEIQNIQKIVNESIFSLAKGRVLLPGDVSTQNILGQELESLGNIEDAYTVYQEASKMEPKNPVYFVKLAQLRISQAAQNENNKDAYLSDAEKFLESAIALKSDYGEAWVQKSLLWEFRKDSDRSVEYAKKALQYNQDVRSGLLVARLLQERNASGDMKDAENILNSILGVNDKELNAQLSLASVYEKTGRVQDAIDRYVKVRDMLPEGSTQAKDQLNDFIDKLKNGSVREQIQEQNIVTPSTE